MPSLLARLTAIDRSVSVRTDDILLLRPVPMLARSRSPSLEQLAPDVDRTGVLAGDAVFEAGDVGDSFYVVADGGVDVLDRETVVRTMGPGEGFGEIALLGDSTRTMTVRAAGLTHLLGVCAGDFLPAVTGISEARTAAEITRTEHLRHARGRATDDPAG